MGASRPPGWNIVHLEPREDGLQPPGAVFHADLLRGIMADQDELFLPFPQAWRRGRIRLSPIQTIHRRLAPRHHSFQVREPALLLRTRAGSIGGAGHSHLGRQQRE